LRSVLMIAYVFPPLGGSGVQRTAKFVKYLPRQGWRPLVVCGDNPLVFAGSLDETLLAEVPPEVRVWRRRFITPWGWRGPIKRLFGIPGMPFLPAYMRVQPAAAPKRSVRERASLNAGLAVLRTLAVPLGPFERPPIDMAIYWAMSIVSLCRQIIREQQVDAIYSTAPTWSAHLAAWYLKRATGLPWVADCRDPWTRSFYYPGNGWRQGVDKRAERGIMRAADRVIGVTPSETQGLRELAPGRQASDFLTIENGYDPSDLHEGPDARAAQRAREPGRVVLAHVGKPYDGTLLPFLRALEQLGAAGARLTVRFVGGIAQQEEAWLAEHRITPKVEVAQRVAHAAAVAEMQMADALLLPIGDGPSWKAHLPGRLFEHMASGTPILLVGQEGEASDLVRASGTGWVVPAGDQEGLVSALGLLAAAPDEFRARCYRPDREVIARYQRPALTSRLAAVLDEVTGTPGEQASASARRV
jgi:glycosyltransferase involved in cell wall biosynthesis